MTMFDTPPVTVTMMTEKELRQDNWRLKGKIDRLNAQLDAFKNATTQGSKYLTDLNNALTDENKRLRKMLGMQQVFRVSSPDEILSALCSFYEVTEAEIKSKSRKMELVKPRHLACYILQSKGFSFKHIGRILGNRDHSTMINAKKNALVLINKMDDFEKNFILELMK